MIDESLLAKVASLSPADRLELICIVLDTLSAEHLPVTDAERALLDARLAEIESNPKIRVPGRKLRPASNGNAAVKIPTRSVDVILARRFNAGIVRTNQISSRQRRLNPSSVATRRTNFHIDLSRP